LTNVYRLIQGDCLRVLPTLADESIDLIVTDPPYGITNKKDDIINTDFIVGCNRILKNTGSLYCFCGAKTINRFMNEFEKHGLIWRNTLIWYYENSVSRQEKSFVTSYEPCLFYTKTDEYTFNLDEIREPYKSTERIKHKVIKNGKVWKPNPLGRKRKDVLNVPTLVGRRFAKERLPHIWQKPEKLIEVLVKASSKQGDWILDPFLGSGTTMKVAQDLGRSCIGIELESKYCDMVKKRCFSRQFLDREVEYRFEVF